MVSYEIQTRNEVVEIVERFEAENVAELVCLKANLDILNRPEPTLQNKVGTSPN